MVVNPETHGMYLLTKVRSCGRHSTATVLIPVQIGAISTADGSATVRLGGTYVTCGIKAEVAIPPVSNPKHGYFGEDEPFLSCVTLSSN